jgi:hypothetical protein
MDGSMKSELQKTGLGAGVLAGLAMLTAGAVVLSAGAASAQDYRYSRHGGYHEGHVYRGWTPGYATPQYREVCQYPRYQGGVWDGNGRRADGCPGVRREWRQEPVELPNWPRGYGRRW